MFGYCICMMIYCNVLKTNIAYVSQKKDFFYKKMKEKHKALGLAELGRLSKGEVRVVREVLPILSVSRLHLWDAYLT